MRRVLFCLLWCALFSVGAVSALAVKGITIAWDTCPETEEFSVGYDCGQAVAKQLTDRYRMPLVAGALLLAVACSAAGILPGTKKR